MTLLHRILIALSIFIVSACDNSTLSPKSKINHGTNQVTVMGSLTYRERIAPPKGATVITKLLDVSIADAASVTLEEQKISLDKESIPVHYTLTVNSSEINPVMRYSVRAEIRSDKNELLWTTDTIHLINPELKEQKLETIILKQIAKQNSPENSLLSGNWTVNYINGATLKVPETSHIQFHNNGRVSATTGCNDLTASYEQKDDVLNISGTSITQKACIPTLNEQEKIFLSVFNDIKGFEFNQEGNLTLKTEDGRTITASK